MKEDMGVSGDWVFFASSHGKGAVDAIGGTVKRVVWKEVKARQSVVSTAEDFYKVASKHCPGINVLYVQSSDIRPNAEFLEHRWQSVLPISGIQKKHIFRYGGPNELLIGRFASDNLVKVSVSKSDPPVAVDVQSEATVDQTLDVTMDEWVLVQYDGNLYPGVVKAIEKGELKVSVMVRSGTRYKWPQVEDAIFYKMKDVIRKLSPPVLMSARGTYEFCEKW